MSKIEEQALLVVEPIAQKFDCYVVDTQYQKEGSDWYLRIFIDKEGGVSITDCETVSRAISEVIDADDFVGRAYMLEVSSPGLERELKKEREFSYYRGREVSVKLFAPMDGRKEFLAVLGEYKDGEINLKLSDDTEIVLSQKKAASIKLYVQF